MLPGLLVIDYLIVRNPYVAEALLLRLIEAVDSLADFPLLARVGEDGTRELVTVPPYVLVYEVDEAAETVRILRVWHAAQDRTGRR
ncbi:type II toxin-antitoxin system RelE/ParE family toxin [Gluconacetobacter aggeris]|uniref:Type II toxin-antitoxin system RelE/ParE family toxin n=1 Tax=Gluconacetobacter aggeris TaxID=1286186 RepID=A0A7W4IVF3_9PROT|nr:type II toxin-antitoxin system RelE/ParE family toxin [Gluconacetobacter aggeris]MBB2169683.1 type II toxin-antitoxin system RelE/ParE family toxin [Gluconacetobacter aggeris]